MKKKTKKVKLSLEQGMPTVFHLEFSGTKGGVFLGKFILALLVILLLSFSPSRASIIDSLYVDSLNATALDIRFADKDSALNIVNQSIQSAEKKGLRHGLGTGYIIRGLIYKDIGETKKAYDSFIEGLRIREQLKDRRGIAAVYNNLSVVERMRSNHGNAIEYSNKAINICKEIQNFKLLARVYINRGKIYRSLEDLDEATKWYQRALETAPSEDFNTISIANENLAESYLLRGDFDKALNYFQTLLISSEEDEDWESVARISNSIGGVYVKKGELRKAKSYYEKSIEMAKQVGNDLLLGDAYINLSRLFFLNNNLDSAAYYSKKVEDVLENDQDIGSLEDKKALALLFSDIYEEYGENDKALLFFKKAYDISEEANTTEREEKLAEEQAKLGNAEKEIKIKKQQNILLIISLLGLMALLVAYMFRQKAKANRRELKFLLETKDLEFANAKLKGEREGRERVARELHDDVSPKTVAIKRELELALKKIGDNGVAKKNVEDAIQIADSAYDKSRQLAYELTPNPLAWLDDIKLDLNQLERSKEIESEVIIHGVDNRINTTTGTEICKILAVLLHNVRKHAKASKISVDITRVSDELVIIVEDDGIGFNASKEGLGLRSVKARVRDLKGTIAIDSKINAGTTVIVNVPLS